MTYGIHRDELALQESKGEGREGGKLRERGFGRGKDGGTEGDVPFITPFALFFLISHLTFRWIFISS